MQELTTYIMYAVSEKLLVSVCSPLELTIISHALSLSTESLIDACGAGDHLDKVDAKIHRIKETMRAVI